MDDDEIWKVIKEPVNEFTESIKGIKANIDKLISFYMTNTNQIVIKKENSQRNVSPSHEKEQVSPHMPLSPVSLAKLQLAIVYAINTCYKLCLITHGENPDKDVVTKELERIKLFMNRAKEVEESLTNNKTCNNSAKRPMINKEASKRLCLNNMTVLKSNWHQ